MAGPKDIKKLMNVAKGVKSTSKAPDLEELLAKLPKGSPQAQLEAQLMFERLQAEKDAFYAPKAEDKTKGKAALREIKGQLRESAKQRFLEPSAVKERLYHGTNKDINAFDPNLIGENDFGWYGPGHYLTIDPGTASAYANYEKVLESGRLLDAPAEGANVLPVHAQLRNPYYWPEDRPPAKSKEESLAIGKELKAKGYDGVIVPNKYQSPEYAGHHEVVVFDPKRIKSAIGNIGTYDIENPDITKAEGGLALAGGGGKLLKALKGSASKGRKVSKAAGKLELPEAPLTLAERQLIAEKAPHLLIPSRLANVEKAIRESKGEFGAKRVQRAADEIKGLEDQYTEEALREAFGGDNATALMIGNPAEFQEYASRLDAPYRPAVEQYWYRMEPDAGRGAENVPYLMLNKEEGRLPFVAGHEGRHRNIAATELGYPSTLWRMLPRAALREPFPRRSQEEYLEALMNELGSDTPLVIPEGRFFPRLEETDELKRDWTKALQLPKLFAEGGQAMAKGGIPKILKAARGAEKAVESGKDLQSLAESVRPLTAAERALAGKLMTEYTANQPVTRLSEALGNVGAEGKKLRVTQADRTAAKFLGGPPFSGLQLVDPRYAEARATWGVKTPGAAKNIANQSDADIMWSTLIGSPFQHKSNEIVFDKLYKAFQKSAKEGNLSEELRAKFNAALEPHFGEGADILDPKLRKEIDTFDKRRIVGSLLLGEQLGGALRGGSIIPGGRIMMETAEPMLRDVETFSIGPRLFTLDRGVISRPDLHPAFPEILQGEDLGQLFTPVPNEIALPTFHEEFRRRTGRKKPGYYDLTMTPPGEPYPTQEITDKYLRHLQREGYAEGGEVHMQGGGNPGEVSGEMFKPKPLKIPSLFQDTIDALKAEYERNRRSMVRPGSAQDVLMRGPVAQYVGTPMDIVGDVGAALEHVQKTHPLLRKPASVMDTGPLRKPEMGYAPRVSLTPEGPYGTEAVQEMMKSSGMTTGTERPLFEIGASLLAPTIGVGSYRLGKALAPTARDVLEAGLERALEPTRMYAVPPSKPGKVKAPANAVGFYNPAEKAALNLQRKQGPGSAFISDMKKLEQGVNDERIAELGLDQLASRPNVTRDEVVALAEQNRIPLKETVRRPQREVDELDDFENTEISLEDSIKFYQGGIRQVQAQLDDVLATAPDSPLVGQYQKKIQAMQRAIEDKQDQLMNARPAKFGPDMDESYSLPGGEDYREIRVRLPERKGELPNLKGFTVETIRENKYTGQRDILIRNPQGNIVTNRYGFRGDDAQALQDEAESLARDASKRDNFYHQTHHDNEPNVLFHLRVANHVDEEGKKGLLIDELQSDWHQSGRDKGYAINKELPKNFKVIQDFNSEGKPWGVVDENNEWVTSGFHKSKEAAEAEALTRLNKNAVPDAPFKDNWYQLGLKRAIKEAVDTGMDRVYLTTGARQADRYDLSKQIGYLSIEPKPNGMVRINASKDGEPVILKDVPKDQLADYVGKDMAKKAISDMDAGKDAIYSDLDLKVGGEGMRQYYDKTYKNFLEKYAKQHGGKLGMTHLKTRQEWPFPITIKEEGGQFRLFGRDPRTDSFNPNLAGKSFDSYDDALKARDTFYEGFAEPVYYIDLTDAMRNSAKKGQSYKDGGSVQSDEVQDDLTNRFNQMLQAQYAEGGAVDLTERFNKMLQAQYAEGGSVDENPYNSDPDMSDGGLYVQAPAFAEGGAVKSIWTVN